jgi:hypothetical protein
MSCIHLEASLARLSVVARLPPAGEHLSKFCVLAGHCGIRADRDTELYICNLRMQYRSPCPARVADMCITDMPRGVDLNCHASCR